MSKPARFRVRPGYQSENLLVEMLGDHRGVGFPDVAVILSGALQAERQPHPERLDRIEVGAVDRFISYWVYAGGAYEIDDDWGGLFISAAEKNRIVLSDIEQALLATGQFVKADVDFPQFR